MATDKMLWDKEHTHSVKASKIRQFGIYGAAHEFSDHRPRWKVLGWFNSREEFMFGYFDSFEEAEKFLEDLHTQIES